MRHAPLQLHFSASHASKILVLIGCRPGPLERAVLKSKIWPSTALRSKPTSTCLFHTSSIDISMNGVQLSANEALKPEVGIASEVVLGLLLLALVYYVKVKLVRNTKDFVIANRKIGFGFGVAGLISIGTWAMAVMMSAAQTYSFGLSGLFWFTVPNGLAVIAAIPFVRKIRTLMPDGYTIPEFVKVRFDGNAVAGGVVVLGALFGSLIEVIINIKGTSLVISNV